MKKIQVTRNIFTNKSTIGDLFFDGAFVCSTLEDTIRNIKVAKQTAIPAGDYKIELRHSNKFDRIMPFLLDVPYFDGVMIHWGNDAENTDGCILVGSKEPLKEDWISSSRKAFDLIYPLIEKTINAGEDVWVGVYGGLKKDDFIAAKKTA